MKLNPFQLYKLLPCTNCKQCGMTCMAFATRLALREVKLEQCPPLLQPEYAEQLGKLRELIEPLLTAEETGIKLDDEKCTGCGNCVVVCPVDASAEASALSDDHFFSLFRFHSSVLGSFSKLRFFSASAGYLICARGSQRSDLVLPHVKRFLASHTS